MAIFTCGNCRHEMPTSDADIGKSAKCPKCGQRGHIMPDPPENQEVNEQESAIPESPPHINTSHESQSPVRQTEFNRPQGDLYLPVWASLIIALSFGILGVLTLGGVLAFFYLWFYATGAPQKAAAGAVFSALFIAGYIITRSIEKVVRSIARR